MTTYQIGSGCVGCGGCRSRCPAKAIRWDSLPFRIDPLRCTGCGRCLPACPLRAIHRIGGIPEGSEIFNNRNKTKPMR